MNESLKNVVLSMVCYISASVISFMNKMVKYKGYIAGRLSQRAVLKLVWLSLVKKYSGKKGCQKNYKKK